MTDRYTFASPDISYSDLASKEPRGVLEWAAGTIEDLAVATSFQSSGLAILHMLTDVRRDVPVLFLDTGFHFPETLEFRDRIVEMWDLNLVVLTGEHATPRRQAEIHGPELYRREPDRCCFINKVEPLQRALEGFDGWISGLRRDQSPLRADTPLVEAQLLPSGKEVLKIHPLAPWTKLDVDEYLEHHSIPTHPLIDQGFASIGCWPCTRAVRAGEDERAGRWDGFGKAECGIHSFGVARGPKETEAEQ
ncbi:MAG: phosphoadenylyl-sulfate reductase [Actinomycetota bacterium]